MQREQSISEDISMSELDTNLFVQECESLCKELVELKKRETEMTEAYKASRKENTELVTEIEGMRAHLNDVLYKNHESCTQVAEYKSVFHFELMTVH
jgi:septal ring factor EnvC (AmiA/AmiB activator)